MSVWIVENVSRSVYHLHHCCYVKDMKFYVVRITTGKDIIIFVTPEDHKAPATVTLADDVETEPGILCYLLLVEMSIIL